MKKLIPLFALPWVLIIANCSDPELCGTGQVRNEDGLCVMPCELSIVDCSDENDCTDNLCANLDDGKYECSNPSSDDGTTCKDGGMDGVCISGACNSDPCAGADCDDENECTADTCEAGVCIHDDVEDGSACDFDGQDGLCKSGTCQPDSDFVHPCSTEGVEDALREGGGPHYFLCEGQPPVKTRGAGTPFTALAGSVILDGQGNLTLDGDELSQVFFVPSGADVVLENITLTGGKANVGGAMQVDGSARLEACTVSGSVATENGGGIAVGGSGTLTLDDTTIEMNHAGVTMEPGTSNGGAIYNVGTVNMQNCVVQDNWASGDGGAVRSATGAISTVKDTTIRRNKAIAGVGGGAFVYRSQLYVEDSRFSANEAGEHGGAIQARGDESTAAVVTIVRSTLSDNIAGNDGGALHVNKASGGADATTVTVRSSLIANNEAMDVGGAVYLSGGTVNMENSTLSGNKKGSTAGAIRVNATSASSMRLTHCTIANNQNASINNDNGGQIAFESSIIQGGCTEAQTSLGNNVLSPQAAGCGLTAFTDVLHTSDVVGGLETIGTEYGGPTQYYVPLDGTPAINKYASPCDVANDQSSDDDIRPIDDLCDVGAIEVR